MLVHAPPGFLIAMSAIVGVPPLIARRIRSWSVFCPVQVSVTSVVVHVAVRPGAAVYADRLHVNGSADARAATSALPIKVIAAIAAANCMRPCTIASRKSTTMSRERLISLPLSSSRSSA
jgi:hypothetical protein